MSKENNCSEHCTAMPEAEMEFRLDNILGAIQEVKDDIKEIKDDTRSHYKSILEQGKDIGYLEKKLKEEKDDIKEKFDFVQKEFSRRDKNNKWFVTFVISIAAVVSAFISHFVPK